MKKLLRIFIALALVILTGAKFGGPPKRVHAQMLQAIVGAGPSGIKLLTGFPVLGVGGANTSARDTTGATLLVIFCGFASPETCAPGDSASNVWVGGNLYGGASPGRSKFYYVYSPNTSATHTFNTASGAEAFQIVYAFSGTVVGNALDVQNGANGPLTYLTFQPGSITPTYPGEVIITGTAANGGTTSLTMSVDSGFSTPVTQTNASLYEIGGASYLIDSNKSAINPTITVNGGLVWTAAIAAFR